MATAQATANELLQPWAELEAEGRDLQVLTSLASAAPSGVARGSDPRRLLPDLVQTVEKLGEPVLRGWEVTVGGTVATFSSFLCSPGTLTQTAAPRPGRTCHSAGQTGKSAIPARWFLLLGMSEQL